MCPMLPFLSHCFGLGFRRIPVFVTGTCNREIDNKMLLILLYRYGTNWWHHDEVSAQYLHVYSHHQVRFGDTSTFDNIIGDCGPGEQHSIFLLFFFFVKRRKNGLLQSFHSVVLIIHDFFKNRYLPNSRLFKGIPVVPTVSRDGGSTHWDHSLVQCAFLPSGSGIRIRDAFIPDPVLF
jgi:hypothetical protein